MVLFYWEREPSYDLIKKYYLNHLSNGTLLLASLDMLKEEDEKKERLSDSGMMSSFFRTPNNEWLCQNSQGLKRGSQIFLERRWCGY